MCLIMSLVRLWYCGRAAGVNNPEQLPYIRSTTTTTPEEL